MCNHRPITTLAHLLLAPAFLLAPAAAGDSDPTASPGDTPDRPLVDIQLTSDNKDLEEGFRWAKAHALELVVPRNAKKDASRWLFHDRDVRVTQHYPFKETSPGPEWATDPVLRLYSASEVGKYPMDTLSCYWGTYAHSLESLTLRWWTWTTGRECFCTRDICHQALGAHLLGLDRENWTMLHLFAKGANENTTNPHWPKWSYDFFGNPYYMDGDWRELPAPLELGEKLHDQFLWTGNPEYINNTDILTYHENLHTAFLQAQDENHNGIADESRQLATLWEQEGDDLLEAGDALGCQYQALLAYAAILEARQETAKAKTFRDKAAALRQQFNDHWYDPATKRYIRGFDKYGRAKDDWGHESSIFIPMKLVGDQGQRTQAYLDFIFLSAYKKPLGIEAQTYMPEVFFKHSRDGMGWYYLMNVIRSRDIYPEVAFTTISNTVCGLMGVQADAPAGRVTTLSHLPHSVKEVACNHVRVGERDLYVAHWGRTSSTITLNAGEPLTWTAQFPGVHPKITVNGQQQDAKTDTFNGIQVSSVEVGVETGQTVVATLPDAVEENSLSNPGIIATMTGTVLLDSLQDPTHPMMSADSFVERAVCLIGSNATFIVSSSKASRRLTAEVGLDDSAAQGSQNTVTFLVNDKAANTVSITNGKRVKVDIPLPGDSKLEIRNSGNAPALVINGVLR